MQYSVGQYTWSRPISEPENNNIILLIFKYFQIRPFPIDHIAEFSLLRQSRFLLMQTIGEYFVKPLRALQSKAAKLAPDKLEPLLIVQNHLRQMTAPPEPDQLI